MEYNVDFIIDEIIDIIKYNIELFLLNDNYLLNLKEYCKDDYDLKHTPYNLLMVFVKETLVDLLQCDYLYDFRNLD